MTVLLLIVAAGSAVGALAVAKPETPPAGCFSVRSPPYRAVGDGKTDDTAALRRAVAQRYCVFLPAGRYRTRGVIVIPAGRRLVGAGRDVTVLHQVVAPPLGSVGNSVTPFDALHIRGGDVEVRGLTIRGPVEGFPPSAPRGDGQKGISIQPADTASRITLRDLRIQGIQTNAINVWNGVRDVFIMDVIIADAGNEGIYITFDAADVTVRNLAVSRVRSWAFDTNGGRVRLTGFVIREAGDTATADDGGGVTWTVDDLSTVREDVVIEHGVIDDCIGSAVNITVPQSDSLEGVRAVVSDVTIRYSRRASAPGVYVSTAGGRRRGRMRDVWLEGIRMRNGTIAVQRTERLFLRDCVVINGLPLGGDASDPAWQGIRIDAGGRPDVGSVEVVGCRSEGWRVGIMWQSVRSGSSVDACGDHNSDGDVLFAGGVRERVVSRGSSTCSTADPGMR